MRHFISLFIICIIAHSCSNSNDQMAIASIDNIRVYDNGNNGNGSDIEVNFDKQLSPQGILEYRVFLIPDNFGSFDITNAEELATDSYVSAPYNKVFPIQGIKFDATSKSVDGASITEGVSYNVAVMTVTDDADTYLNSLVIADEEFELTVNNQLSNFTSFPDSIGVGTIVVDSDENLYVPSYNILDELDAGFSSPSSIFRISKNGSKSTLVNQIEGQIGSIFLDDNGTLFPVLRSEKEIGTLPINGSEIELINQSGFDLVDPVGIYIAPDNTMYVADKKGSAIIKITEQGETSLLASVVNNPRGITGDAQGNIYVSHDNEQGTINKITPDGTVTTLANIPTYRPEDYVLPYAMWAGHLTLHEDHLYVCGMSTDRIYKVSLSGEVEVFAGSGTRGIPRGGALTADLNRPYDLAFNADGNKLYISGSGDVTPQHVQGSLPGQIWVIDLVE